MLRKGIHRHEFHVEPVVNFFQLGFLDEGVLVVYHVDEQRFEALVQLCTELEGEAGLSEGFPLLLRWPRQSVFLCCHVERVQPDAKLLVHGVSLETRAFESGLVKPV